MSASSTEDSTCLRLPSFLLGFGLAFAVSCFSLGLIRFWDSQGFVLFSSARLPILIGALLSLPLLLKRQFPHGPSMSLGGALALLVLVFSDWLTRDYGLLAGTEHRGEIVLLSVIAYVLLSTIPVRLWALLPVVTIVILASCFFRTAGGELLISDDHSVFLHRIDLLTANFPFIPVYDSQWNAGLDSLHLFATGVLNFFFLYAPLWYLFEIASVYNVVVVLSLFFTLPLSVYIAARLHAFTPFGGAIAASLAATSSLTWFRWAIKYGTMGFVTSISLLPLVLTLLHLFFLKNREVSKLEALAFVVVTTLALFWPPTALILIPAAILVVFEAIRTKGQFLRKKYLLISSTAILALSIPWMLFFWSGWNVSSFLEKAQPTHAEVVAETHVDETLTGAEQSTVKASRHGKSHFSHVRRAKKPYFSVKDSIKKFREIAVGANPLILLFFLPGLLLFPAKHRLLLFLTLGWMFAMGFVATLKPQLELERMFTALFVLGSMPSALAIQSLIEEANSNRRVLFRTGTALAVGVLFTTLAGTALVVQDRSIEHFYFTNDRTRAVTEFIKTRSTSSRTLFSGFSLHEYHGGHLAPLTYFTQKPLVASSHVHNLWQYHQVVPQNYMDRGDEGIEEFFDVMNVGTILAHEPVWRDYFTIRPDKYRPVGIHGRYYAFERIGYDPSYFIEGSGEILSQTNNGVTLRLDKPNAILKFHYFKSLEAGSCTIEEARLANNLHFIELRDCPVGEDIKIRSKGFWERLYQQTIGK